MSSEFVPATFVKMEEFRLITAMAISRVDVRGFFLSPLQAPGLPAIRVYGAPAKVDAFACRRL
jgi:hypothetical protein